MPCFPLARRLSIWSFLCVIVGVVYLSAPGNVGAQVTILYNFGVAGQPAGGTEPNGGLVLGSDGTLYGTTVRELDSNDFPRKFPSGTVFRFDPLAGQLAYLKSFPNNQQLSPQSPLLLFKGGVVGVISDTNSSSGAIFHLSASGTAEIWHQFGLQTTNGNAPLAPLILAPDGYIYGGTILGGYHGQGTVYKLNPANHQVTLVHSFNLHGVYRPNNLLLGQDGNFYGTASASSGTVIFMMTPAGAVTTLYTFNALDTRQTLIQASDGAFYGTTEGLGAYQQGSVFKMTGTPLSVTVTVLHSFGQGNDGVFPSGPLVVGPNGNLYGETASGGTGRGTGGNGIIFEITMDGSTYTVLHKL
jgi:uncharacterized repeat protein (TIGR03803 family)